MNIRSGFIAAVAAVLVIAAPAPVALAQAVESQPGANVPEYSDTELKTFAVAVMEVQRINEVYSAKLQAASTPEEQETVVQTATNQMTQVVEKNGMSVDRFTQILNHAQMSPGLADRVRKHMQEVRY